MSILGLAGSLRDISNTNKLVKRIAEATHRDYEIAYLGNLDIKPCKGCSHCMMNEGQCSIQDAMGNLVEKMFQADALVIGSPTYCLDVTGAVKCVFDRSMCLNWRGVGPEADPDMPWLGFRPLTEKPVVIVTTAAGDYGHSLESLRTYAGQICKMKIVDELGEAVGVDDVDDMPDVLERANLAGKRLGDAIKG